MRCFLLALSVALVCGAQAVTISQSSEELDIQKVSTSQKVGTGQKVGTQVVAFSQSTEELDIQKVSTIQKVGSQAIDLSQSTEELDVQKADAQNVFVFRTGEDLDIQKVAGTWYSVVMAASDFTLLNTEGAPLRLHIKELRPTPEGGLEVIAHRWEEGRCVEKKMLAEKTEIPAEFNIRGAEDGRVQVLDTDYETYAFLCMQRGGLTGQGQACQYLARTPKADQVAMDKFDRAMKQLPIHIQLLFTPAQAQERCRV